MPVWCCGDDETCLVSSQGLLRNAVACFRTQQMIIKICRTYFVYYLWAANYRQLGQVRTEVRLSGKLQSTTVAIENLKNYFHVANDVK